eukprot:9864131-Alexandrium_andersonii.AAC.1
MFVYGTGVGGLARARCNGSGGADRGSGNGCAARWCWWILGTRCTGPEMRLRRARRLALSPPSGSARE